MPFTRHTVDLCDNPELAPAGDILLCYASGWRLMRRDSLGQWRNMMGAPKQPPKLWGYPPEIEDAGGAG